MSRLRGKGSLLKTQELREHLQFKLHVIPCGTEAEQQSSIVVENNCFVCRRSSTKYPFVACTVIICNVCSVPANEDNLGYN